MERHPYRILAWFFMRGLCVVRLRAVDLDVDFGMTGRMKALLDERSTCRRCSKKCLDVGMHFSCEGTCVDSFFDRFEGFRSTDIDLILSKADVTEVEAAGRYETACISSFRRSQRLRQAEGKHTTKEVRELLHVQDGRCYYCGGLLLQEGQKSKFHRDHYVALSAGGRDGIGNIVLACAQCNMQKGDVHGDVFLTFSRIGMSEDAEAQLRRIHNAVTEWRQSLQQ